MNDLGNALSTGDVNDHLMIGDKGGVKVYECLAIMAETLLSELSSRCSLTFTASCKSSVTQSYGQHSFCMTILHKIDHTGLAI